MDRIAQKHVSFPRKGCTISAHSFLSLRKHVAGILIIGRVLVLAYLHRTPFRPQHSKETLMDLFHIAKMLIAIAAILDLYYSQLTFLDYTYNVHKR